MPKYLTSRRIIIIIMLLMLVLVQFVLPGYPWFMDWYIHKVFGPLQFHKIDLFSSNQFSAGDFIYCLVLLTLLYHIVRFIISYIKHKSWIPLIRYRVMWIAMIVITFLTAMSFLWNINYKRDKVIIQYSNNHIKYSLQDAIGFQQYLIEQLNGLDAYPPPHMTLAHINNKARAQYSKVLTKDIPAISVEPSIFGSFLQNVGIQGYYNPITSEAQINKDMPPSLMPFVVTHEMAHQLGIANEGDANLVSYIVCSQSDDRYFRFSAYLNIFIYNQRLIAKKDSVSAKQLYNQLAPHVSSALSDIYAYRLRHKNWVSKVTLPIYEAFLRVNGEDGLGAYANVAKYAMIYERHKDKGTHLVIRPFNG